MTRKFDCRARLRFVRATLGAAVVGLTCGLHAGGLFLPVGSADAGSGGVAAAASASQRQRGAAAPVEWERQVRIARRELAVARGDAEGDGAGRLQLDLRDDVRLDVVVERTAPTKWGYSLSGRAAGGNVGFVTLVVHEEAVAGTIWTPDAAYELNHLGGGVHTLRDVTNAPPFRCATAEPSALAPAVASAEDGDDDGSVVDILVVWVPEYEEQFAGGEPAVLLSIDMMIAYTNDALERSGALVSLNLVGAEKVDYRSDTWNERRVMEHLVNPDDGHMDRVHDWRDTLGADLVSLTVPTTSRPRPGAAYGNFSISINEPYIFAHEIGHNMGLNHERAEREFSLGKRSISGFYFGFTRPGRDSCGSISIMSYGTEAGHTQAEHCGTQLLPFYASPWRYHPDDGRPLGVTRFSRERGVRGPADAVGWLNRFRHYVANLRKSRSRE